MAARHHEYAFDAQLKAAIRIRAATEREARDKLDKLLDAASVRVSDGRRCITFEASLATEPDQADLFQVDGTDCTESCPRCSGASPDGGDGHDGYCADCADKLEAQGHWN